MTAIPPPKNYRFTDHARLEMQRRDIEEEQVTAVLESPEQAEEVRPGRVVYQSRFAKEDGRVYLLRVIVDVDRVPAAVVTAYWTSKVRKYWREE